MNRVTKCHSRMRGTPWTRRRSGGFTLIELLLVLSILATLSGMYMGGGGPGGAPGPAVLYPQRAKAAACAANRNIVTTQFMAFQIEAGRAPTAADLASGRINVPRCPEGGRYYFHDGQILCTVHAEIAPPPLY